MPLKMGSRWWERSDSMQEPQVENIHPAWKRFIRFCKDLSHGEIEKLTIQDGVPVLAETVKKKTKFT